MADMQEVKEKFILHWGEMGTRWGINRTMAQVQALLFISERPLSAEEIMTELQISRGNVSMSLRELMNWGIVNKMHVKGERKEFFTTEKDVWELFKIVLRERKKREIDPTLDVLHELIDTLENTDHADKDYVQQQLQSLLGFVESGTDLYDYTSNLNPLNLMRFSKQTLQLAQKVVSKDG
ncbi:MAG: ArsR family transcriptional regulator [Chloroflexota bacterium]